MDVGCSGMNERLSDVTRLHGEGGSEGNRPHSRKLAGVTPHRCLIPGEFFFATVERINKNWLNDIL